MQIIEQQQQQPISPYVALAHLSTFSMIITDDGAIAIPALSKVNLEEGRIVILLISGVEIELSETATQQFLDQTRQVADGIQRQMNSNIATPYNGRRR